MEEPVSPGDPEPYKERLLSELEEQHGYALSQAGPERKEQSTFRERAVQAVRKLRDRLFK